MHVRFLRYAPVMLLVAVATAGCNDTMFTPASPAPLVDAKSTITAEPLTVEPEFLHGSACSARPPFGLTLSVIAQGGEELILRGLRFQLTDGTGTGHFPIVIPISSASPGSVFSASTPSPNGGAAALPSSPIPFPGASPTANVLIPAGTQTTLPFYLRFGCGVIPEGTLVITIEGGNRFGRSRPWTLRLRVARRS